MGADSRRQAARRCANSGKARVLPYRRPFGTKFEAKGGAQREQLCSARVADRLADGNPVHFQEAEDGFKAACVVSSNPQPGNKGRHLAPWKKSASIVATTKSRAGPRQRNAQAGTVRRRGKKISLAHTVVDPDYFDALGMTSIAGRPFNSDDRENSVLVAAINQDMAGLLWPG